MNLHINVRLHLSNKEDSSHLRIAVYNEALNEINNKFPLNENEVDIKKIYLIKNNNNLETEFFIRNGCGKNIYLEEDLELVIQNKDGSNITSKVANFKNHGIIPPFSASPFNVRFEINEDKCFVEDEEYFINVVNSDKLKIFSLDITEVEGIPLDISFEEERNITDFISNLPALKEGELKVLIYKISYTNDDNIECALLIRNGTTNELDLSKLVVSVVDQDNVSVAQRSDLSNDVMYKIEPIQSKLVKIKFSNNEVFYDRCDLSKCRIILSR